MAYDDSSSDKPEVMKLAPSSSGSDPFSCIYSSCTSSDSCDLLYPLTKPNVHSWTNSQLYRFE